MMILLGSFGFKTQKFRTLLFVVMNFKNRKLVFTKMQYETILLGEGIKKTMKILLIELTFLKSI